MPGPGPDARYIHPRTTTLLERHARRPATNIYGGVDTSRSAVANVVSPCFSTAVTVPPVPVHSLTAIVLAYDVFPDDTLID